MRASRPCWSVVNAPQPALERHALARCVRDGDRASGRPLAAYAFLGALLLAFACAASPRQPRQPLTPRPPPQMPRSSVAAVLAYAHELDLAPEQIQALRSIDEQLASQQGAIRGPRHEAAPARPEDGDRGMPLAGGEMHGQRGGGRGIGGERGGPRGGRQEGKATKAAADPEQIWNDNDTAAYLAAEDVLRPDQRARARAIAEAYREQLYEVREVGRRTRARDAGDRPARDPR